MTLVLTSLSHEHILQVADRRLTLPDGSLYDDDTNKAVFYCGRVAVAYTGLAIMEGKPTAEWIASCMKDAANTESAMREIAKRAEQHLKKIDVGDQRLAVVATGWGTYKGAQPPLPFICVASNFMNDQWNWEPSATRPVEVRYKFLPEKETHELFVAGQNLTKAETKDLDRKLRRAVAHKITGKPLARLLGTALQYVASGHDARAKRVGKGMIIHLLTKESIVSSKENSIVTPLTDHLPSFLYVSKDGRTDPFQGPVVVCNGIVLGGFGGGSIPPGGKSFFRSEMEKSASR